VYQGVSWLNNSQPGFLGVLELDLCPGSQVGKREMGTRRTLIPVAFGCCDRLPAGGRVLLWQLWRSQRRDFGLGAKEQQSFPACLSQIQRGQQSQDRAKGSESVPGNPDSWGDSRLRPSSWETTRRSARGYGRTGGIGGTGHPPAPDSDRPPQHDCCYGVPVLHVPWFPIKTAGMPV
jgi:hypothetical protein